MHRRAPVIRLIANAHLDPVWIWRWPEGCAEIRGTCRAAAGFLERDRELRFCRSSAGDLRWLVELEPALVARIRRLVRAGRWESVGGWWTQPDGNIPSGESFVRQGLHGQRFFRDTFGRACRVGYNVDSFGHHANLPQILAQSGMPFYVFMRPGPAENPAIPEGWFWWEGVDGTRVLAFHLFDPYNASATWGMPRSLAACRAYLERTGERSAMLFVGVGDHGGGLTRALLDGVRALRAEPGALPMVYTTPGAAFEAAARDRRPRPVHRGELQHHAAGSYAAHAEIKRLNRRAEEALLAAERTCAAARAWTRRVYPAAALRAAWQDALFNQFHDILAGSSVREAYVDSRDQMGRAIFGAEECLNAARQSIAARVDTRGAGQAVILFNPHTVPFDGLFETENVQSGLFHWEIQPRRARVTDASGRTVAVQFVEPTARAGDVSRMLLRARIPALGYTTLRFRNAAAPPAPPRGAVRVGEDWISNGALRVTAAAGGLRVRDLRRGREALRAPGLRVLVLDDPGDTWGHDVVRYDRVRGAFRLRGARVIESGPLRARLRAAGAWGRSRLWIDALLEDGRRAVELRIRVRWLEPRTLLKLSVPVAARAKDATFEIPYAALCRPARGDEEPMQRWVDVGDGRAGASLVNQGLYSAGVHGAEIRQTLLRSAPYTWSCHRAYPWKGMHVRWREDDDYMDLGVHEFRLLLLPHDGDWRRAGMVDEARRFQRPLEWIAESAHDGPLPAAASFVNVEGRGVEVSVVKEAEDGRGFVLRAVETRGRRARARLAVPSLGAAGVFAFRAWQIRTFRVRRGAIAAEPLLETGVP